MNELDRELSLLNNDRQEYEKELSSYRNKYSELLRNGMGKDIDDVINGKIKVKLSFKERFWRFIDNIFNKI